MLLYLLNYRQFNTEKIKVKDRAGFVILGFVGITLTYGIYFNGLLRTSATDASLLFACEPILITIIATAVLHERPNGQQWAGLMVGLLGIWVIAGLKLGNWLALLGLSCECFVSVLAKDLTARYSPINILARQMLLGSLFALPMMIVEIIQHPIKLDPASVTGWIYLSLINSALCYGIWFIMVKRYPLSRISIYILIQPLSGPFYAWLFIGEPFTMKTVLGMLLVIAGIILTSLKMQSRGKDAESEAA